MNLFVRIIQQAEANTGEMELIPRVSEHSILVLIILISCILFVSMARLRQKEIFGLIGQNTFLFHSLEDQQKEGAIVSTGTTILLGLQFAMITSGAIYWYFFIRTPLTQWNQLIIPLFAPTIYLIYQLTICRIAGSLTGQKELASEINYFTLNNSLALGIIILLEFFFSYFQSDWIVRSQWLLIITYAFFFVLRVFRGFFIGLNNSVPWYYIILYFWSLEILPLLIVARLLFRAEFQTWLG